jgi:glycosyltransferase involved in cell wall biosynthesis
MNNRKPYLSIGLPVYNGERFLEEALASLLAQTFADFELIICDNASTDGTAEICRNYVARDRRLRYFRNVTNIGFARNFNRVFALRKGDYFKWASADDLCEAELLAHCLEVLETDSSAVLAYPKTRFIDATGKILEITDPGWDLQSLRTHERLRYVIPAAHWVNPFYGLIRGNALSKTQLMPNYPGGDYHLLAELSLQGKFVEIPQYLFHRRIHAEASSQNASTLMWTMEFHSGDKDRVCLPLWNRNIAYVLTILKADLSVSNKLSLLGTVGRSMWWRHRRLLQEIDFFFRFYLKHLL